ncbi:terminase small subunit [Bordetella hinzii CA90 BAL1384]|uniref:terminase small subunit n=1 Tax=Bordetella hinzii TaxID=103855 RepID=UPI00045B324D|nr:terminase small subunit [Bordetella hinzii]KCB33767.1 terminase small subunit [Bordetella hinzii CA90 BAL1384]
MQKTNKLTPKQARFVEEFLVDLNATQAAIRAGYSEKTAYSIGNENLSKPEIAEAIQAAQAERAKRTEITQDMVLRELAKIGFSDIRKIVRWGKTELRVTDAGDDEGEVTEAYHGLALVSADEIDDNTAAAISEISEGREGLKVKLHDKKGALVDIGRHLGMFKDRIEHSGPNGGPIPIADMTDEELAAIASGGRA